MLDRANFDELVAHFDKDKRITVVTGAGVSSVSGIQTFRGRLAFGISDDRRS